MYKLHYKLHGMFQLGILFGVYTGFSTLIMYHILFKFILREMPKSFTYGTFLGNSSFVCISTYIFFVIHCHYCFPIGEAAIISQGLVIFLSNSYIKLIAIVNKTNYCLDDERTFLWTMEQKNTCEMEQLTTILQAGQ